MYIPSKPHCHDLSLCGLSEHLKNLCYVPGLLSPVLQMSGAKVKEKKGLLHTWGKSVVFDIRYTELIVEHKVPE